MQQGDHRGTLFTTANRQADAVFFELHIAEGDPEGNWKFLNVNVPPVMQINDREPGEQISLRLRGHNIQGEGAWSSPFSIRPN